MYTLSIVESVAVSGGASSINFRADGAVVIEFGIGGVEMFEYKGITFLPYACFYNGKEVVFSGGTYELTEPLYKYGDSYVTVMPGASGLSYTVWDA